MSFDLPESWALTTLSDVVEWTSGGTPKSGVNDYYDNGTIDWLNISDLKDGKIDKAEKKITELGLQNSSAKIVKENSVLVAIYGSIGKLGINSIPLATNQAICFTKKIPSQLNNKFLFYYLMSIRSHLISLGKGGTQQNISQTVLNDVDFTYAPLNEQNRIVEKIETLFSEIDAGVESLSKAKTQLERYRQSLLKHAFEGKLTAQWRAEFESKNGKPLPTADELIEQIQTARQAHYDKQIKDWELAVKAWEDNGKNGKKPTKPTKLEKIIKLNNENLPKSWAIIEFNGLCDLVRNGISTKPIGDNGQKIFRISAVRALKLNLDDYRFVSDDIDYSNFLLKKGDLLFTRYNGTRNFVGVCAEFDSNEDYLYPDKLIRATVNLNNINNKFLAYGLNSGLSRKFIENKIRTTAGQSGISGTDIKNTPVVICLKEEQDFIINYLDEKLSEVEKSVSEISIQLEKAKLLKSAILHKAFQGKLVPQDPTDLPASQLLDQIKAERLAKQTAQTATKSKAKANKQPKAKTKES